MHVVTYLQTSEREMIRKELSKDDHSALQEASEDVIYKIDIPANRCSTGCSLSCTPQ
jgi:hypothetical protein